MKKQTSTIQLGAQMRTGEFRPDSMNAEERTVNISWGTGDAVKRHGWDESYYEVLEMTESAVDMTRMNSGNAGLFTDHYTSVDNQKGVIVRSWIENGEGMSTVRFSRNDSVTDLWNDVKDGIIKNASVGYRPVEATRSQNEADEIDTITLTRWLPHELSLVGVGADAGAQVRSDNEDSKKLYDVELAGYVADDTTRNLPTSDNPTKGIQGMTPEEAAALAAKEAETRQLEAVKSAKLAEKERMVSIRSLCDSHKVEATKRDEWTDGEMTIDQVRSALLDHNLAVQDAATRIDPLHVGAPVTSNYKDNADGMVRGISDAIVGNILDTKGVKFEAGVEAKDFKNQGRSIVGAARHMLGAESGDHAKFASMSKNEIIERSMNASGHFPKILANVANKSLQAFYQEIPATWESLADATSVSDFKNQTLYRVGEAGDLRKVNERGEYERSSIAESSETLNLLTYGRMISFTRQLLINDDMGALADAPRNFAQSVRRLESDLFWGLVLANPIMGEDGKAVFHADHDNVGTPAALGDASLAEARKSARLQRGLAQRDGSQSLARLNVMMKYLIVAPELENEAYKVLANIDPQNVAAVNQWAGKYEVIVEPRLQVDLTGGEGKAWFLAADAAQQVGRIKVAYLDGNRSPFFDSNAKFENDGIEFKVRHDVGFAFSDFRGWSRNVGV